MINHTTLANGLTVLTSPDDNTMTVRAGVTVLVGGADEDDTNSGVTHFLEHMLFKSTTNHSATELVDMIERVGGSVNAGTEKRSTSYYVKSRAETVDNSLSVLADMLCNSLFRVDELDTERGVVLQEMALYRDDTSSLAWDSLYETLFPEHAAGVPLLGTKEVITSITPDEFRYYMARHYVTGNTIVWASGKVNHEEFVRLVEEKFATYPVGERAANLEPIPMTSGYTHEDEDHANTHIILAYPAPLVSDPASAAYHLFAEILAGGMSSPVFKEVREDRGLAYSVYGGASIGSRWSNLYFAGGTTCEHSGEFIRVLADVIRTYVPTEDDLLKAKNQTLYQISSGMETAYARLLDHIDVAFMGGFPTEEGISRIHAVTLEDILAVKAKIIASPPSLAVAGRMDVDIQTIFEEIDRSETDQ